jgi:endoglucanase
MKSATVSLASILVLMVLPALVRSDDAGPDAFYYNRLLGRGVNFGNALEAQREGQWGLTLKEEYFARVKQAGFDSVRLPVRWSAHALPQAPYTIDPAFFRRIDWAIGQALGRGLIPVVNVHHYEELYQDPDGQEARFLALWRQIGTRYRNQPDRLFLELLNEPHGNLTSEHWQRLFPRALSVIRESNPNRVVIVGPGQWNNLYQLPKLHLPEQDRRLIATFHYYDPMKFTHQEAGWVPGSGRWKGTTWTGSAAESGKLHEDFSRVENWARSQNRPVYLGEFGSYQAAPLDSRRRWTQAVAREAEQHSFSWAYWEFGAGFGIYDPMAGHWRQPLLGALLDHKP